MKIWWNGFDTSIRCYAFSLNFEHQIAVLQTPGRYFLKPGVELDSSKKLSSESGRYLPYYRIALCLLWFFPNKVINLIIFFFFFELIIIDYVPDFVSFWGFLLDVNCLSWEHSKWFWIKNKRQYLYWERTEHY